jgi:hypothetical protein
MHGGKRNVGMEDSEKSWGGMARLSESPRAKAAQIETDRRTMSASSFFYRAVEPNPKHKHTRQEQHLEASETSLARYRRTALRQSTRPRENKQQKND